MSGDLSRIRLRWVEKELRQVGLAISIAGTRRAKLIELSHLAIPAFEALVGERPEVKKVRNNLRIRIHNVRRSNVIQRQASRAVYALADSIGGVMKLVEKGMGDVPPSFGIPPMALMNDWGYTEDEVRPLVRMFRQLVVDFSDVGLRDVLYGISLDPSETKHRFVLYDGNQDMIFIDADKWEERRLPEIYKAFAERISLWFFLVSHRDTWKSVDDFAEAFSMALSGDRLDDDRLARLRVTMGPITNGGWSL